VVRVGFTAMARAKRQEKPSAGHDQEGDAVLLDLVPSILLEAQGQLGVIGGVGQDVILGNEQAALGVPRGLVLEGVGELEGIGLGVAQFHLPAAPAQGRGVHGLVGQGDEEEGEEFPGGRRTQFHGLRRARREGGAQDQCRQGRHGFPSSF